MNELARSKSYDELYSEIKNVLTSARNNAVVAVNTAMVKAYWAVGKLIVDAQGGELKAAYGASGKENAICYSLFL